MRAIRCVRGFLAFSARHVWRRSKTDSGRARSADCDPPRRDSVPRRSSPGVAGRRWRHRGSHLPPDLQQAGPAGHRSAPGASECRSDREARCCPSGVRSVHLRRPFSPRGLRDAVKRGANLIKITDVTGHKSLEMLKTYSRDAEAFVGHAGAGLL
jgi:hypothetical protein